MDAYLQPGSSTLGFGNLYFLALVTPDGLEWEKMSREMKNVHSNEMKVRTIILEKRTLSCPGIRRCGSLFPGVFWALYHYKSCIPLN
jgi:hypothetical protein